MEEEHFLLHRMQPSILSFHSRDVEEEHVQRGL